MRYTFFIFLLGLFFIQTFNLCSSPKELNKDSDYFYLKFNWDETQDQVWLGYNFWCNSFLDWRVQDSKAVAHPFSSKRRTAHITSHSIVNTEGKLSISSKIKLYDDVYSDSTAIYGFLIGAGDTIFSQQTNNFIFNTLSPKECHLFGIKPDGKIQLINYQIDSVLFEAQINEDLKKELFEDGLRIEIEYNTDSATTFKIFGAQSQKIKIPVNYNIPIGNIALFYSSNTPSTANASFDDILIESKDENFKINKSGIIGPILSTFYTNTEDSLFLTAQLMPYTPKTTNEITFKFIESSDKIEYIGEFDSSCYQIRFRIPLPKNFKSKKYLVKSSRQLSDNPNEKMFTGKIRSKPRRNNPKLMALNCNGFSFFNPQGIDYENLFYPYQKIKEGYQIIQPDILTFLGDQIYESRPEMAIYKKPFCHLDYIYKWSIWCYAFRDITLNQPTIIMTDDHDVFQGNLWGNGGVDAQIKSTKDIPPYYGKKNYDTWQQDHGGYFMGKDFVNMVIRSQTGHLPFPKIKSLKNGIINYYTSYKFGDLNFAILEDKKFKSPPSQNNFKIYNGFPIEKNIKTEDYHNENFKLLGKKQLEFLNAWSGKSKKEKEFKIILTQSAYASLTTIQENYSPLKDRPAKKDKVPQKVSPDMDSNGWPKIGRDRALESLNDSSILFISGDQHMGAVIDVFDSSNTNYTFFSVPAIANTWPRMWWPNNSGSNSNYPLGNYIDAFGNKINVKAVANPNPDAPNPNDINRKSPGFGIIEFKKKSHKATLHAYPLYFNSSPTFQEFEGWPIEIRLND